MSNQLENFINNNREAFDSEEMKINWEKVRSKASQKKTTTRRLWWAAAASIIIFITSSLL
jgi:hypothetical protein